MRISELGRRTGVSARTLRHYEELGLVPARRRANGYRTVTVTDATFDELVLRAARPVLVDFTADWCLPCRMILPVLREIAAEQQARLVVARLDVDANPVTARAAGVLGMPTLTLYVDGRPVLQVVGAKPKAVLLRLLAEHLSVTT